MDISSIGRTGMMHQDRMVARLRAQEAKVPNAIQDLANSLKGLSDGELMSRFDPRNMSQREVSAFTAELRARGQLPQELAGTGRQTLSIQKSGQSIWDVDPDEKFDFLGAINDRFEFAKRFQPDDTAIRALKEGWDKLASRMTVRDWKV